jgi:hypothetical protein
LTAGVTLRIAAAKIAATWVRTKAEISNPKPVDAHTYSSAARASETDKTQPDVGQLLADKKLPDPRRRGVEIGNRAQFLLAHHADRGQHRRNHHQQEHDDAGNDGKDAAEILVVTEPYGNAQRQGVGLLALRSAKPVLRIGERDTFDIAARRFRAEGHAAVEEDADLGPSPIQQVCAESGRHLDRKAQLAGSQSPIDIRAVRQWRMQHEIA